VLALTGNAIRKPISINNGVVINTREIKFRGQITDIKEWVYGDLTHQYSKYWIYQNRKEINIIPETIGQYTGLKDKNGKEIYEGDFLQYDDSDEINNWCRGEKAIVVFSNCSFLGRMKPFDKRTGTNQNMLIDCSDVVEIVGNIYEATEEQKKEWGLE